MSGFEKKVSLTGDRGFESFSLQQRVVNEPSPGGAAIWAEDWLAPQRFDMSAAMRSAQLLEVAPVHAEVGQRAIDAECGDVTASAS